MKLPRKPQAVVFDLDGTLIDSEALVRTAYDAVLPRFGVTMSDAQFLSLVGLHRDLNNAQLRSFYGANFPLEDFYASVRAQVGERTAPLKDGASELMDALDAHRLPFGLATSSYRPWVERHLAAHALDARFTAIVTRDDVANGKPHPEPYLNIAAALGTAPANVLALEDSYAGVTSAHAAGLMTVMIPDLLPPTDDMRAKALLVLPSLHDVHALLS